MSKVRKYLAVFNLSFQHTLKNYKALIGLSIFLITCLVIFAHLWKLAAAKTGVSLYTPTELLWYIAFNEWVLISIPDIQENIEEDLRTGRLAYLLPRPISYLGATFAEAIGTLTANLLFLGVATFLFTSWQTGLLPFHPTGLCLMILFGFLAGLVAVIFQMLVGLSAFWLHEVTPFFWIWEKLLFMLGGLMLPLALYPQWMQTLAHLTPFPAILGERSALAIEANFHNIVSLTGSLMAWGFVGLISVMLVYRKGLRILNIEGG